MQNHPPDPQPSKATQLVVKFTLGAVVSSFVALVPLSYIWWSAADITISQLLVLLAFGGLGGVLGLFSSPQQIGRFFDSIPWF